ncbi:hypothetical protein, partial [Leptospira santarosai]|uniref:hypothetical protein n=1 Tax=Leptospira santarosai TaxID=28183 RepID=UPI001B8C0B89
MKKRIQTAQALERDKICGNSHGKRWAKKRIQTARVSENRICGNSHNRHWMKQRIQTAWASQRDKICG